MEDYKFKPGDLVQLKSGGPKMTVERQICSDTLNYGDNPPNYYTCTWFAGSKGNSKRFVENALKKYSEENK